MNDSRSNSQNHQKVEIKLSVIKIYCVILIVPTDSLCDLKKGFWIYICTCESSCKVSFISRCSNNSLIADCRRITKPVVLARPRGGKSDPGFILDRLYLNKFPSPALFFPAFCASTLFSFTLVVSSLSSTPDVFEVCEGLQRPRWSRQHYMRWYDNHVGKIDDLGHSHETEEKNKVNLTWLYLFYVWNALHNINWRAIPHRSHY